ncbi:hypothetical protein KIF59_12920 [Enterobacter cloacae subsp. cloacae]|nr:hypothetical protein [Enterobacter cloacae subsp. cloacae]
MLGWVITCHDEQAQEMLMLEVRFGPLAMSCGELLARAEYQHAEPDDVMPCHETDTGEGVIFLTDKSGAAPYRAAALLKPNTTAAK